MLKDSVGQSCEEFASFIFLLSILHQSIHVMQAVKFDCSVDPYCLHSLPLELVLLVGDATCFFDNCLQTDKNYLFECLETVPFAGVWLGVLLSRHLEEVIDCMMNE